MTFGSDGFTPTYTHVGNYTMRQVRRPPYSQGLGAIGLIVEDNTLKLVLSEALSRSNVNLVQRRRFRIVSLDLTTPANSSFIPMTSTGSFQYIIQKIMQLSDKYVILDRNWGGSNRSTTIHLQATSSAATSSLTGSLTSRTFILQPWESIGAFTEYEDDIFYIERTVDDTSLPFAQWTYSYQPKLLDGRTLADKTTTIQDPFGLTTQINPITFTDG